MSALAAMCNDAGLRLYLRALDLAIRGYAGRTRKDGKPVLFHALTVVEILREVAGISDYRVLAVALLHDILEESLTKYEEVESAIGASGARLVAALTEDKRLPKSERKSLLIKSFGGLPADAKIVKLADRLDNVTNGWLRTSADPATLHRYRAECQELLRQAEGVCPNLEKALEQAIRNSLSEEPS